MEGAGGGRQGSVGHKSISRVRIRRGEGNSRSNTSVASLVRFDRGQIVPVRVSRLHE